MEIFLNNILRILEYFQIHNIDLNDKSETVLSYPKFLTSENLFDIQLNDSSFRLTILTQIFIVVKSFLRPVSLIQKKAFVINENEKKKINEIIKNIQNILIQNKSFSDKLLKIMLEEENWENWKESGCSTYEKKPDEDVEKQIEEIKIKLKNRQNKHRNIKAKNLFKIDTFGQYDFNKQFEVNLDELKNIKNNFIFSETLNSENPFLGTYIERILKDTDPDNEIEESVIKSDETFAWKFLRLVSQNDISKLNNDSSIELIIKEYLRKYGKPEFKNSFTKESKEQNNHHNLSINKSSHSENIEETKEIRDRETSNKSFIKKKRSIDRSESNSYSGHKKRKLD